MPPKNLIDVRSYHDLSKQGENLQFFSENSPKSDLKSFRLGTSLTNPFYNNLHKLCKCMYCEKSFENVDSNFHAVFVFYLLKFVSSVVVKFVVVVVISYNSMKRKTILLVFKFLTYNDPQKMYFPV